MRNTVLIQCCLENSAEYSCNGWWEEMGTSYLITTPLSRSSTSSSVGGGGQHRRVCFIFRENPQFRAEKYYRQSSNFYDETGGGSVGGFSSESPTSDLNFYGRFIQFSTSPDSCHRHFKLGSDGSLAFNVTSQGNNWIFFTFFLQFFPITIVAPSILMTVGYVLYSFLDFLTFVSRSMQRAEQWRCRCHVGRSQNWHHHSNCDNERYSFVLHGASWQELLAGEMAGRTDFERT